MKRTFWPLLVTVAAASPALAQVYPAKVIRIVTVGAGGGSDFATRLIAPPLAAALGQQVIVDNRPAVAADIVAKAAPDGYTLLLNGPALWLLPFMRDNVASSIDDFTPVTMATQTANTCGPSRAAGEIGEGPDRTCESAARQLNLATSGNGNSVHIAGELFKSMTGTNIVRVNYKGASQALIDLAAGQTQIMFAVPGTSPPHVKAGRLRALAVTSAEPSPLAPGLPTVASSVPGYESVGPGTLRASRNARLHRDEVNQEVVRALHRPEVNGEVSRDQHGGGRESADATASLIKAEVARMGKVIEAAHIRAD